MNPTEVVTKTDFHTYSLKFFDDSLEKKYTTYRIKKSLIKIRLFYFVTLFFYCIYLMSNYFYEDDIGGDLDIFYIKISLAGFLLLIGILVLTDYYEENYIKITSFVIILFYKYYFLISLYTLVCATRLFFKSYLRLFE